MTSFSPKSTTLNIGECESFTDDLVNLSHLEIVRQHWNVDVYCSTAVWTILVNAVQTDGKACAQILHEIFQAAKLSIADRNGTTLRFPFRIGERLLNFELHCGSGHTPIPVLTLSLQGIDALPIS